MSSHTAATATQAPRWRVPSPNGDGFITSSTIESDTSQPVIDIESVDDAENYLLSYLGLADPLYNLRLRIPKAIIFSKLVENILLGPMIQHRQRFTYDPETSILRVYAMSRPVHNAVSFLVSAFVMDAFLTGFVAPEERKYISCGVIGVPLAHSGFHANQNTNKLQPWFKYPDAVITFEDSKPTLLPSVIFETGFAESYIDLVSDVEQWLKKSGGKVRLVVLVNLKEDISSRRARQGSNEGRKRILELKTQFGNTKAKDEAEIDNEGSDAESNADLYDEIRSAIIVEDWVGPIRGTLETVLPKPPTPQNPTIYITDIVPEKSRTSFEGFDETRTMKLDMDKYRELLTTGISELAYWRALGHIRPRRNDRDSKYIPRMAA